VQVFLGLVHGFDALLTSLLLGGAFFCTCIAPAGGVKAMSLLGNWVQKLKVLLALTFVSTLIWLLSLLHDMTESYEPSELWRAAAVTRMGNLGCLKLLALTALFFSCQRLTQNRARSGLLLTFLFFIPLFSVLSGHSASQNDFTLARVLLDWLHSIAIAIWAGGLCMLYSWIGHRLKTNLTAPEIVTKVVTRFSHFAMVVTALIITTGFGLAYLAGVSLLHPWESRYGTLITVKLAFFLFAMAIAASNQFMHIRQFHPDPERKFSLLIRRGILTEFILICFVFGIAGVLARTAMPGE
jgi:putative copper export protein